MYTKLPYLIIGFHGRDSFVADSVISKTSKLKGSTNEYDWLGHGVYFWEQSLDRAWKWAQKNNNIENPA